jgi:hypothetical protein
MEKKYYKKVRPFLKFLKFVSLDYLILIRYNYFGNCLDFVVDSNCLCFIFGKDMQILQRQRRYAHFADNYDNT